MIMICLIIFNSCSDKISTDKEKKSSENKKIFADRRKSNVFKNEVNSSFDSIKGFKLSFKYFDLYVKSNEDSSAVEVEYERLDG